MTLFKRGMIFVTFFGSCLSLGLLVAALGTKYWVVAHAKRVTNPEESDGKINFGLFQGRKELNVAYGWRTYQIDIPQPISWFRPQTVAQSCTEQGRTSHETSERSDYKKLRDGIPPYCTVTTIAFKYDLYSGEATVFTCGGEEHISERCPLIRDEPAGISGRALALNSKGPGSDFRVHVTRFGGRMVKDSTLAVDFTADDGEIKPHIHTRVEEVRVMQVGLSSHRHEVSGANSPSRSTSDPSGRSDNLLVFPFLPSTTTQHQLLELLHSDKELLVYSVWVATIGCLAAGLLCAALSAIFAVTNTATTPIGAFTGVPGLYLWNALSIHPTEIRTLISPSSAVELNTTSALANYATEAVLFSGSAVGLWSAQFFKKLQQNVMSLEDRGNLWSSENMASLGYSFWFFLGKSDYTLIGFYMFVVGCCVIHLMNIIVIYVGTSEPREKKGPQPILEEKSNGAIMLY
uniref:Uncharacterized protein n=1 Tax=Timema tahoe TaxID=61484 RepID=A0A7R9IB37_9NEOP|nr:unnamed protein product [Timema tahoe]